MLGGADGADPERERRKRLHGHRERLRRQFLEGLPGGAALPDYQLIELLLFGVFRQGDVRELARELVAEFGSAANVLAAEPAALARVKGVGEAAVVAIKVAEALAIKLAATEVREEVRANFSSYERVIAYCRTRLGRRSVEEFHVLFLDSGNRLLHDERQHVGTVNEAPAYPREVCRRALEVKATAVVLVHNHPSGDPTPSDADLRVTRRIVAAARTMGIHVHDHLIVTPEDHFSFRAKGLL